jgi:hypothetical protein
MCAVSYVGDYWRRDFPELWHPGWKFNDPVGIPLPGPVQPYTPMPQEPTVSKREFDALKKEMEELKKLLKAAKKYDEAMGEPDCEMDDKVALIKKVAKHVGVDMGDVFGKGDGKQK